MGNFNNENLIPFTGELKPGQRLLKRPDGYFIPVGASAGGGNSMDFYKCTSVDTINKTWTGYKAIQNTTTEIYSFEQNVTSGLSYNKVTPTIGKVYSDGALVEAFLYYGLPIPDHAYLGSDYIDFITKISGNNDYNTTIVQGKHGNAYNFENGQSFNTNQTFFNNKNQFYISVWIKYGNSLDFYDSREIICQPGSLSEVSVIDIYIQNNGKIGCWIRGKGDGLIHTFTPSTNTWVHALFGIKPNKILISVNGITEAINHDLDLFNTTGYTAFIGSNGQRGTHGATGSIIIDELYIWQNLSLSDSQFQNFANILYNSGNGNFI